MHKKKSCKQLSPGAGELTSLRAAVELDMQKKKNGLENDGLNGCEDA